MGFNGFYWVLLGFTGFYWVLLYFPTCGTSKTQYSNENLITSKLISFQVQLLPMIFIHDQSLGGSSNRNRRPASHKIVVSKSGRCRRRKSNGIRSKPIAHLSRAAPVGMLRAKPRTPVRRKYGMQSMLLPMTASESHGVTKNAFSPRIMLRSCASQSEQKTTNSVAKNQHASNQEQLGKTRCNPTKPDKTR